MVVFGGGEGVCVDSGMRKKLLDRPSNAMGDMVGGASSLDDPGAHRGG